MSRNLASLLASLGHVLVHEEESRSLKNHEDSMSKTDNFF